MNPVGVPISTAYGKRGGSWSCQENAYGEGVHTGCDFAADPGTPVFACRPGVTYYVSYGSAFGGRQLAVRCDDGGEDFYAHMEWRVGAGLRVRAGDQVGRVGYEGNVVPKGPAGAHLHLERHPTAGYWSCLNHQDPQPSIDYPQETVVLDAATADQVRAIVQEVVLGCLRGDGVSGAADAGLMRQRWLDAGLIPATLNAAELASVLRSEGVSAAADAAVMQERWAQVGGIPVADE